MGNSLGCKLYYLVPSIKESMSTCPGNVGDYFIDANSLESYKNDGVTVKRYRMKNN